MSPRWSESKYLVVAPCVGVDANWSRELAVTSAGGDSGPILTSRDEFMSDLLAAVDEVTLPDRVVCHPGDESSDIRGALSRARLVTIAGIRIFSAELVVSGADGLGLTELEAAITNLVEVYIDGSPDCPCPPMWVNRTLVTASAQAPEGWLAHSARQVFGRTGEGGDAHPSLSLGWGNNALVGYTDDSADLSGLRYGILIGQALWVQLSAVDTVSGELISDLAGSRVSLRRGDGISRDLEVSSQLALHGLCRDELATTIQGVPARVAQEMLEAWEYPAYRSRLADRSAEISRILDLRAQLRSRGYQHTVELVLFGIGLLTILSTVLDVVQTGFSGGVEGFPGEDGDSLVMEVSRGVNLDAALSLTVGVMVILLLAVIHLRRRSDA